MAWPTPNSRSDGAYLVRVAAQRGGSPWDAMVHLVDEAALPARALVPLRQFREAIETLRLEASPQRGLARGLRGLLERILELSGYGAALAREDHRRFVDAFRNGMIRGVESD